VLVIPPAGVVFPAPALLFLPPSALIPSPSAVIRRSALAVVFDSPEFRLAGAVVVITHFRLPWRDLGERIAFAEIMKCRSREWKT